LHPPDLFPLPGNLISLSKIPAVKNKFPQQEFIFSTAGNYFSTAGNLFSCRGNHAISLFNKIPSLPFHEKFLNFFNIDKFHRHVLQHFSLCCVSLHTPNFLLYEV
jgi:hypothetical protein